jgi:rhodanese-related sulfurtransferase
MIQHRQNSRPNEMMTFSRRRFLLAVGAVAPGVLLLSVSARGQNMEIAADLAFKRSQDGALLVIDVRSPQEWGQSGVPQGARLVTIHGPDGLAGFVEALRRELGEDTDRPVALICARGQRSTVAQAALIEAGFTQVLNIREGVFGSRSGPGWLTRDLPMESCRSC